MLDLRLPSRGSSSTTVKRKTLPWRTSSTSSKSTISDAEEIVGYNEIIEQLNKTVEEFDDQGEGEDKLWKFRAITGHQGPLQAGQPGYNGSSYNLCIEWETGETAYEPAKVIIESDPISVAEYARKNDLLNKPGFKRLRRYLKVKKKML